MLNRKKTLSNRKARGETPLNWCQLSLHPATKDKFVYPTEFPRDLAMQRRLTLVTKLCLSKKCHHIVQKAGRRYKCPLFFEGTDPVEGITSGSFWFKKPLSDPGENPSWQRAFLSCTSRAEKKSPCT